MDNQEKQDFNPDILSNNDLLKSFSKSSKVTAEQTEWSEAFAQALLDRQKKYLWAKVLPSLEKQVEYIFLTLKKQEKRYKRAVVYKILKWLIIIWFTYLFFVNKQFMIDNYIMPEVEKNINSALSWSKNKMLLDSDKATYLWKDSMFQFLKKRLQDTADVYKQALWWE